ncbi:hypothetical protein PF001_g33123, partial [Phytophthora fragariae]
MRSLRLLAGAVLAAVQVPDAAAGLDARHRELPVQPLRIPLEQPKVLGEHLVVASRHRAERAIHERREVDFPPLALEVPLNAGILRALVRGDSCQRRALRVVVRLLLERHGQVDHRHRL